jgi:hypothetical protein
MNLIRRTERLGLKVASEEVEMLRELCRLDGVDMSTEVRTMIRQRHAERIKRSDPSPQQTA